MQIAGITSDSRKVRPGFVFVAIRGQQHDGHQYLNEALERGASLLVVEQEIPRDVDCSRATVWRVTNSRLALAELACEFFDHPSKQLVVIGVTGTNGKTTTSHLCHHILSASVRIGLIGSVRVDTVGRSLPGGLTTPESVTLQAYMREMLANHARAVVMEVSSHGIKQHRVHGISFDAAVFTNLSPDHMDFHPNFQDYLHSKTQLFRMLPSNGLAVLNLDDPYIEEFQKAAHCQQVLYSLDAENQNAHVCARNIRCTPEGCRFQLVIRPGIQTAWGREVRPEVLEATLPLLGSHNVANALSAIALGLWQGASPTDLVSRLESFRGVPRRLQIVRSSPWWIIDDYAHNQANYRVALQSTALLPYQHLRLLVSVRGNRGSHVNREMAEEIVRSAVEARLRTLVVTDAYEAVTDKDRVTADERAAFWKPLSSLEVDHRIHCRRLDDALRLILSYVQPGDAVLLLGAQGLDRAQEILAGFSNEARIRLH